MNERDLRDALRALIVAHGSFDEARRPCGTPLPMPYAHALLALRQSDGRTATELAELIGLDRSNVSRLATRMVDDGVLERRPHGKDGRATALFLTDEGRERAQAVDETSAEHFAKLQAELGDEVAAVVKSLERLRTAMEAL